MRGRLFSWAKGILRGEASQPAHAVSAGSAQESPSSNRGTKARLRGHVPAAVVFGLVGMITGSLSLYITWRTTSQEAAVVVDAYPTASTEDLTHAGLGVRVQLVNESLRPVIVEDASLWVDDRKLSDATGYLEDARLLDQSAIAPAVITDSRLDFPISMNARQGRPVAILMDVWQPIVSAETSEVALKARRELNQLLTSIGSLVAGSDRQLELELQIAPGGLKRFPVRGVVAPGVYPEAIRDASAIQRQTPLENWVVAPHVAKDRLVGLALRRRFAGGGQVDLVRLDVWALSSQLHWSDTRPILGQQAQLFRLDLPKGAYVATFRLGGEVIAHRSFSVPWREVRCDFRNATGPVWCPAERARHVSAQD